MEKNESFITLQDHKPGFPNKSCRLNNPSKSKIRSISKSVLDKLNQRVLGDAKVNQ